MSLERDGDTLVIRPAPTSPPSWMTIYTVVIPGGARGGMPRISIGAIIAMRRGLVEGVMEATVEGGAIVIGAAM